MQEVYNEAIGASPFAMYTDDRGLEAVAAFTRERDAVLVKQLTLGRDQARQQLEDFQKTFTHKANLNTVKIERDEALRKLEKLRDEGLAEHARGESLTTLAGSTVVCPRCGGGKREWSAGNSYWCHICLGTGTIPAPVLEEVVKNAEGTLRRDVSPESNPHGEAPVTAKPVDITEHMEFKTSDQLMEAYRASQIMPSITSKHQEVAEKFYTEVLSAEGGEGIALQAAFISEVAQFLATHFPTIDPVKERLAEALRESNKALDDWSRTHAPDCYDQIFVEESERRIQEGGSTVYCIASRLEENREALAQYEAERKA